MVEDKASWENPEAGVGGWGWGSRPVFDRWFLIGRFLFEVQLKSTVNKMNVENLATVMGINLLKPQIEDPISVMKGEHQTRPPNALAAILLSFFFFAATPLIQKLMTVMISQHQNLFPPSKDKLVSPPSNKSENQKNAPRSFVGWESAEMGDASLSESPEEEDSPTPDKGSCSPQIRPPSPSSDLWHGGPRKRTQTLPTFNCPLTGMAAKADALNRWSRIQESSEEKCGTLSEDIFKILDLQGFGGSQIKTKEEGETLTAQTGDTSGSSSAGSQDANSDDQAPGTSPQRGGTEVAEDRSAQLVESRTEQKNEEQQLPER